MAERKKHNLIEDVLLILNEVGGDRLSGSETKTAHEIDKLLNEIPGGFLIYKADGDEEILYANEALIRTLGCRNMDEFRKHTNNSFRGLVHPDDLDAVEASIVEQIASSQYDLDYVEYRVTRKDGVVRWIEDYGHFIHDDVFGDIFYVFLVDATDKIERRMSLIDQTEEKERRIVSLKEEYDAERMIISQEHLRRLEVIEGLSINYTSILYVDLDTDSVFAYRLSDIGKELFSSELIERKYSTFVGEYVKNWVDKEDKKTVKQMLSIPYIKGRLADSKTYYCNFKLVNSKHEHMQFRVVNVGEGCSQIVIGFSDVEDEFNQEMRQKRILEGALDSAKRAADAKNIFLSNMSHDMRTPLNAIFGYTTLAKRHSHDAKTVNEYLEKIQLAGEQILELTEKVLELTYIESHTEDITEAECDLCDVIEEAVSSVQTKAINKKIDFVTDYSGIKMPEVFADGEKLKQILMQLADNAVKYTKPGGRVELRARQTNSLPNSYNLYEFVVSDTGMGISKELLPTIFEPFVREFDTTTGKVFGSGIGLTIVKNFIDAMDGKIEIDSAVGVGTKFTVTIGFRECKRLSDQENMDRILSEIKTKKILIVEDNEINLEIEREILEELGFSVDSAENGKVAVDKLVESPEDYYAVILMDIQMPVMDGRRATEIIRGLENPKLSRIPIIALSANAFESDKRLSAQAGIDAHLDKPLDVAVLLKTMSDIVSARRLEK